jgi:hypothetical protein
MWLCGLITFVLWIESPSGDDVSPARWVEGGLLNNVPVSKFQRMRSTEDVAVLSHTPDIDPLFSGFNILNVRGSERGINKFVPNSPMCIWRDGLLAGGQVLFREIPQFSAWSNRTSDCVAHIMSGRSARVHQCDLRSENGGSRYQAQSAIRGADIGPQFMFGGFISVVDQILSGGPQILRVVDKLACHYNQKSSEKRDQPLGKISSFVISFVVMILGFHLQLAAYCYIDRRRKLYVYCLLASGVFFGFLGHFALVGHWWTRLWGLL